MKSARRLVGVWCALLSVLVPAAGLAATGGPVRLTAAAQGQLIEAPGADARAEVVTFGEDLAPSLLRISPDETVQIAGWPVAPGERADVRLTRFEVYAPGARIWKVEGDRRTEVPRSRMAFFRGTAEDDPETRIFLAVEPDTSRFEGLAISPRGTHEIRPFGGARGHLVTVPEYFLPEAENGEAQPLSWTCGQSEAESPLDVLQEASASAPAAEAPVKPLFDAVLSSLHTVTVAVDTDNELLLQKFANNTTNATNYVAALIAAMNVIYERDLNIRLLQGSTNLRVSTTADPYTQAPDVNGTVSSAQLSEFANYWATNYGGIQRGLAMMLSGKSPSSNSSSGRAYVTGLCSTSNGYSFSQVFKFAGSTGSTDAFVVGHELGHNFGSLHTHCYNPPIDTCYVQGGSCYSGPTSCPAVVTMNGVPNVRGTLMSYCHLLGGCTASNVFHPTTVDLITGVIQPRINNCVFPAAPPAPTLSTVSPASGTTAGGTVVSLTGTNFESGATVTFGGTAASSVTFNSSTRLTATVPAHAAGSVSVVVTNPDTQTATRNPGFFYMAPAAASDFYTVTPCRLLDTRNASGPWGGPALGPSTQRTFTVTGLCGVPSTAQAVVTNVTVVQPTGAGLLAIFPGNAFDLGTSVANFSAGQVRANNAVLLLATNGAGTIGIRNNSGGTTHVIVDITGYFD